MVNATGQLKRLPKAHYAVSHGQKRLWIFHQLDENSVAYNLPWAHVFTGNLDVELFERSVNEMMRRHESLRTSIISVNGEPRQKIHDATTLSLHVAFKDLRAEANRDEVARALANREASTPFDLEKPPLFRVSVLQQEDNKWLILFTMHHIISDAWSKVILVKEFFVMYSEYLQGRTPSLPDLRIQYKDYAAWQNGLIDDEREIAAHRTYLMEHFKAPLPILELPLDFPRTETQSFVGRNYNFRLNPRDYKALKRICNECGCTLFVATQAALKALLYCLTGQQDIIVGMPVANREHPDLEHQIGLYINTMAIRTIIQPVFSFRDLIEQIKISSVEAQRHQVYPFDVLVTQLSVNKDRSRNPLFDVGLNFNNTDYEQANSIAKVGDFDISTFDTGFTSVKTDLWFNVYESDGALEFNLNYNISLFTEDSICKFLGSFELLIDAIASSDKITLGELRMMVTENQVAIARLKQERIKNRNISLLKEIKIDR